jgi:GNAT superfamily N-acetyltransferase
MIDDEDAMVAITRVHDDEGIAIVVQLARQIWHAHYVPIIGVSQVDYMLGKFQSDRAIRDQLAQGVEYYLMTVDRTDVGYMALVPEPEWMFLSKIYVLQAWRGHGLGSQALALVETRCRQLGRKAIRLTVNRFNTDTLSWYLSKGFVKIGSLVQDIGSGYVMDDFEMEKCIEKGE